MARVESDLPPPEEREALLGALAELVARGGPGPLLTEPVLPEPRFFPDAWDGGPRGAVALATRILSHAGLGHLDAAVDVEREPRDLDSPSSRAAVAWFCGIRDGRVLLGIAAGLLADPVGATAALAHESAHAWRAVHGLRDEEQAREEMLVDATTVYLGFGLLTANAASRYRSSGDFDGARVTHRWSHERLGYLSPAAMSFLLAAQAVAQGAPAAARRRLRAQLETNQAAVFGAACRLLGRDPVALRRTLGLPAGATSRPRAVPSDEDVCRAAEAAAIVPPAADVAQVAAPPRRRANEGRTIFRVRQRRIGQAIPAGLFMGVLATLGMALVGALALPTGASEERGAVIIGAAGIVGALVAVGWGWHLTRVRYWCSDPDCSERLGAVDPQCPRCGGVVRGTIRHWNERLEAEERLSTGGDAEGIDSDAA